MLHKRAAREAVVAQSKMAEQTKERAERRRQQDAERERRRQQLEREKQEAIAKALSDKEDAERTQIEDVLKGVVWKVQFFVQEMPRHVRPLASSLSFLVHFLIVFIVVM